MAGGTLVDEQDLNDVQASKFRDATTPLLTSLADQVQHASDAFTGLLDDASQHVTRVAAQIGQPIATGGGKLEDWTAAWTPKQSDTSSPVPPIEAFTSGWTRPAQAPVAASGAPSAMPTGQPVSDGSPPQALTGTDRQSRIASARQYADAAEARTGVPADVNLAFAVHESGLEDRYGPGNSFHGRHAVDGEEGTPITDWGYDAQGNRVDYPTKLKSYATPAGSFDDFADLIASSPRYRPALDRYRQTGDKDQLIRDIWAAGYGESKTGASETEDIRRNQTSGGGVPSQAPSGQPAAMSQRASGQYAAGSYTPNQINAATSEGLDYETALAVCGPAAAIAFARKTGRNPTMAEAVDLARQVGWTAAQGMAGPASERSLLQSLGVASRLVDGAPDWSAVAADVQRGNPVIVSTPGHYFVAERYDPTSGQFDFGESAAVLKAAGGRRWFKPEEITSLGMGEPRASLFMDSPESPSPSVVAGGSNYKVGADLPDTGMSAGDQKRAKLTAASQDMLRAPLLPTDPEASTGADASLPFDPRDQDAGPRESGYTVGGYPSGGEPIVPDSASGPSPSGVPAPATYGQSQDDPGQAPGSPITYLPPTAPLVSDRDASVEMPTRTPVSASQQAQPASYGASQDDAGTPPAPPRVEQAGMPAPSGFPGLQAVYDSAGNFLHWIQRAADQIGQNVQGNRQAIEDANAGQSGGVNFGQGIANAAQAVAPYVKPMGGALEMRQRMREIEDQAASDQGRTDLRAQLGDAVNDPAWRAAHPDLAAEYDDLSTQFALVAGGMTEPIRRGPTAADAAAGPNVVQRVRSALDANAERVAQADARAAEAGSMTAPGTLGVISNNPLDANTAARSRIVPPDVADTLDFPVRVPSDPATVRAIEAAGGSVDPERGVSLNLIRYQGPEAHGQAATRASTFYTADKPGARSPYEAGQGAQVGGSDRIEGPTRFRSPLVLSDAPGSRDGFNTGMQQLRDVQLPPSYQVVDDWDFKPVGPRFGTKREAQAYMRENGFHQGGWTLEQVPNTDFSRVIDTGIRTARAAGAPGSPERARALKSLVRKYGGDPGVIDDLMRVRGADDSESAWAIKENILAHNARRQGYDGVLTVQPQPVDHAALMAHPDMVAAEQKVTAANDAEQAAWVELNRRYQAGQKGGTPEYDAAYQAYDQAQARTRAALRESQAVEQRLRDEMKSGKITELADFRESHNPTPGAPLDASLTDIDRNLQAARQRWHELAARVGQPDGPSQPEIAAATAEVKRWEDAYNQVLSTGSFTGPPSYTLRPDIARRGGETTATGTPGISASTRALGDVSNAIGGGVGGATIGAGLPAENDEDRRRNALIGAGVGMVAGPAAGRLMRRGEGALATPGVGPNGRAFDRPNRPSNLGDVPPSRIHEPGLPGFKDIPSRRPVELPASVGDAAAQQEMRAGGAALPGMERAAADRFAPVREARRSEAVSPAPQGLRDFLANPESDVALPGFEGMTGLTEGQNAAINRALANANQRVQSQAERGITRPSAWDWIKQAGYSGIYSPATLVSSLISGTQELIGAQPKEAVRALVQGRPGAYGRQVKAQIAALGESLPGVARVLTGNAAEAAASSGGSQGTAGLSERVANPVGRFVARTLEKPGEILTEAPDAVFRPLFRAQGEAREASAVASEAGLRGRQAAEYADRLMQDVQAVRNGELPTMPETQRVIDAGVKHADELGYKGKPGAFGQWLGSLSRRDDPIGVVASFLAPFPGMASRMTGAAVRSTPGAALVPSVRRSYPSRFDMVYDQAAGTLAATGIGYWAMNGGVTGSGPSDPEQRAQMVAQGWQPNSVLIAGHYIPNRQFGRFQAFLDTAGELHDALAYGKADRTAPQIASELVKRGSKIATDQIGLSGLADLHDMLESGFSSQFPGWAARSIVRYLPYGGVLRSTAASLDPNQRRADRWDEGSPLPAIGEQVKTAVPGLRQSVPAAQDVLGRPMENPQRGLGAFIPRTTTLKDDPVIRLFQDAGVDIGKARDQMTVGRVTGVSLKPAEQRRWNELRGQFISEYADAYTGNQEFMALPPAQKEKYLKTFLGKAADYADKMLQSEMDAGDLTTRATDQAMKKAVGQ